MQGQRSPVGIPVGEAVAWWGASSMRVPIGLITSVIVCCASYGWAQAVHTPTNTAPTGDRGYTTGPPTGGVPSTAPIRPVFMRQTIFAIPFAVPQVDQTGKEVHLFVSGDRGASWKLYAREPATRGQFAFQAAQDGEYWFASHTVPVGTTIPAQTRLLPELKVVVDTTEPKLDLQAAVNRNGEIEITWEAVDEQIYAESLKIEYQAALGQAWRPVQIEPATEDNTGKTLRGQTAWQPEGGGRFVSVRAEIHDMAGNVNRTTRRLLIPTSVARNTATQPRSFDPADIPADPLASLGLATEVASSSDSSPGEPTTPKAPDGPATSAEATEQELAATQVAPYAYRIGSTSGDADTGSNEASTADEDVAAPAATTWPSDVNDARYGTAYGQARTNFASSGNVDRPASQEPVGEAPESSFPSEMDAQAPSSDGQRPREATPYGLPPGERPRMTRTTRFNLAYSVDAAGPMGLEKVELWVSRNGGADWNLWGTDEDMESPFLVDVDSEGIYGFRVVLVSRNGLASQTPRSGDLADLWVGIDTTKPIAEITSAAYGESEHAGHLNIQWTAADDHLGPRPITLVISETQDGPWTPIASGLPNNGQYFWRVDSGVPDKFYLRLEVRDEAGNLAVDQLTQPIASAGLTPRGRVSDFEPLFE